MQGTTTLWMELMAPRPQQSLGVAFTGAWNRNVFVLNTSLHTRWYAMSFLRERNNGKIIRACDTEALLGGGVQYHKCYDQDGRIKHRYDGDYVDDDDTRKDR